MAKARTDREQGYQVYGERRDADDQIEYSIPHTDYCQPGNELYQYLTPDERRVLDALRSIRYGSVTVEIQDGRLRLLRKGETENGGVTTK